MKLNKKGITIVELIVVITILAILGTVGFLSFQSYNIYSRDVKRLTDIKNIKSVLEYTYTESGLYPTPDGENNITFSGSTAWIQGTFGNKTKRKTKRLSNVPLDPLTQNQYSYSVTVNKNEFEIGGVFEGDEIVSNNLIKESYADESNFKAYISGNYNGKIVKVKAGTINYILSAPSIILNDYSFLRLEDIIEQTNSKFVINGNKVMPESYGIPNSDIASSDFIKKDNFVVFSGSLDDLSKDEIEQEKFINNLILAYSGTTIENNSGIKEVINSTSSNKLFLSQTILKNSIDESIKVTANNVSSNTIDLENPLANSCLEMTTEQVSKLNTFFSGTPYNGSATDWCGYTSIMISNDLGLSGDVPREIGNLKQITQFRIQNNSITSIPEEIGELVNLDRLFLGGNGTITSIPERIGELSNLLYFYIDGNVITSVPSSIGDLSNLQALKLNSNSITSLPTEIGNLSNLTALEVPGNNLTTLPASVGNLDKLINLLVYNNSNLTSIPSEIGDMDRLVRLYLYNNNLSEIPANLKNLDRLTDLRLSGNTGLGVEFNRNFNINTADEQKLISSGETMTIGGNGTNVIISVN